MTLQKFIVPILLCIFGVNWGACQSSEPRRPNVVFIFADEWRGQDVGYMGNEDVMTPNIDKLASESINVTNAIAGASVCCPYRGSLLTGQYPLTNGVFVNDVQLDPEAHTFPKVFKANGYETAYIGKWHLDGHGRGSFIPEDRRHGFSYWKVLECPHNYTHSYYWDSTDDEFKKWEGTYDAFAQTKDAIDYINNHVQQGDDPFLLVLSWGPPHEPFERAPEEYKQLYREKELTLRANVPEDMRAKTLKELEGYYGHMTALDKCVGDLQAAIKAAGIEENTIFIFTSDHGHMVNSHNLTAKQKPFEESISVPFLLKYPAMFGTEGRTTDMMLNTPDIMPTLLGLSRLPIPEVVEGRDLSPILSGEKDDDTDAVLITCPHPFGQWSRNEGGKEYRGVRTKQYTYVRDLDGPWLLFDNQNDEFQLNNLVNNPEASAIRDRLDSQLMAMLKQTNDEFLPGMDYVNKWGYLVDETETVPFKGVNFRGMPIIPPPDKAN